MAKRADRIGEPEARAAYLALGADRSLAKLVSHWRQAGAVLAPSLRTLKRWCQAGSWTAGAAEHDARVSAKAAERVEAKQVDSVVNLADELLATSVALLKAARDRASSDSSRNLVEGAVAAAKLREVLLGGVSDRTEDKTRDQLAADLARRLERAAARRAASDRSEPAPAREDRGAGEPDRLH